MIATITAVNIMCHIIATNPKFVVMAARPSRISEGVGMILPPISQYHRVLQVTALFLMIYVREEIIALIPREPQENKKQ
jgi:hypothetical protein